MPPKVNPLKLNPLQLKTLVLFQELARYPETSQAQDNGDKLLTTLPRPHGNHFHVGSKVAMTKDASGLTNPAVWVALERKGLIRAVFPHAVTLTVDGQGYDVGPTAGILHGSDH